MSLQYSNLWNYVLEKCVELEFTRRHGCSALYPPSKNWKWYLDSIREEQREKLEAIASHVDLQSICGASSSAEIEFGMRQLAEQERSSTI